MRKKNQDMKKLYITLSLVLSLSFVQAQSTWPYLVAPGAGFTTVNTVGLVSSDLLVISDNEIYNAINSQAGGGVNIRLEFNKYLNGTWTNLADITTTHNVGRTILRKAKNSNDIYVAYSHQDANFVKYVTVKKFDGTSWTSLGTEQEWGHIYFDFQLDNNDVPILLGKKSTNFQFMKIMKWQSNAWTEIELTGYLDLKFFRGSSYVDANNNLVFLKNSVKTRLGVDYGAVDIDTLIGDSVTTHFEDIRTTPYSEAFFLLDSNGNQMFFTQTKGSGTGSRLALYKNTAGTWAIDKTDTSNFNLVRNVAVANTGVILFAGVEYGATTGTMYDYSNLSSPVYSSPVSSEINHIRFTKNKVYALIKNGVVTADVLNLTGINSKKEIAVNMFPNPVNSTLTIQNIASSDVAKIEIYSIKAELMQVESNTTTVNVENLCKGMYILLLEAKDGSVGRTKFIKE